MLRSALLSYNSRNISYVGEVGIWTGIWGLSTSALQTPYFPRGTMALAAISPIFTYFLVRKVGAEPQLKHVLNKTTYSSLGFHHLRKLVTRNSEMTLNGMNTKSLSLSNPNLLSMINGTSSGTYRSFGRGFLTVSESRWQERLYEFAIMSVL